MPRPDPTLGGQVEARPTDRRRVQIAAVDVRGDDVAYVVNYPLTEGGEVSSSDIWLNRGDRPPRLVARVRTGGASSGFREFLQPRLSARSVVAFQQGRDQGNGVQRWSLGGRLLGAGSIGLRTTNDHEVTGGTFDRGRFIGLLRLRRADRGRDLPRARLRPGRPAPAAALSPPAASACHLRSGTCVMASAAPSTVCCVHERAGVI